MRKYVFLESVHGSWSFDDDFVHTVLQSRKSGIGILNGQNFIFEIEFHDGGHFQLIGIIAMIFNWQNNGSMIGMVLTEIADRLDYFLERNSRGHRKPVLDNWFVISVVSVYLNATKSIVEILPVPLGLGVRSQLVSSQVGVVWGVAVIFIERFRKVLLDFVDCSVYAGIGGTDQVLTEFVEWNLRVDSENLFNHFIYFLVVFYMLFIL